jgi:hypothetical protein
MHVYESFVNRNLKVIEDAANNCIIVKTALTHESNKSIIPIISLSRSLHAIMHASYHGLKQSNLNPTWNARRVKGDH